MKNDNFNIDAIFDESMIYQPSCYSSFPKITYDDIGFENNIFLINDSKHYGKNDEHFVTNNFERQINSISYGRDVLDCIAQTEMHSYEKKTSEFESTIKNIIFHDEYYDGELSASEQYMIEANEQGHLKVVLDALMKIYVSSLDNLHILEGILVMISCVPYDVVAPAGQVMAMGLLSNKELSIRDKAIQCFEKWNSKKGLDILKNLKCSPKWLQQYVDQVSIYIEKYGIN